MDLINCHCGKSMSHHRSRELSDGNLLEGKFDLFLGNFVSGWIFPLGTMGNWVDCAHLEMNF